MLEPVPEPECAVVATQSSKLRAEIGERVARCRNWEFCPKVLPPGVHLQQGGIPEPGLDSDVRRVMPYMQGWAKMIRRKRQPKNPDIKQLFGLLSEKDILSREADRPLRVDTHWPNEVTEKGVRNA